MRFMSRRFSSLSETIGDAGVVARLIEPDAVSADRLPVRVQLFGTWTRGRTIVAALGIDGPRIARLWLDTIKAGR